MQFNLIISHVLPIYESRDICIIEGYQMMKHVHAVQLFGVYTTRHIIDVVAK